MCSHSHSNTFPCCRLTIIRPCNYCSGISSPHFSVWSVQWTRGPSPQSWVTFTPPSRTSGRPVWRSRPPLRTTLPLSWAYAKSSSLIYMLHFKHIDICGLLKAATDILEAANCYYFTIFVSFGHFYVNKLKGFRTFLFFFFVWLQTYVLCYFCGADILTFSPFYRSKHNITPNILHYP